MDTEEELGGALAALQHRSPEELAAFIVSLLCGAPPGVQSYTEAFIAAADSSKVATLGRALSENTLNGGLRPLGYSGDQMTAHGFRSVASTLLHERGVNPDLIELQLAHAERNRVRAAYNRAQRLAERRIMMQEWSGYLDTLRKGVAMTRASVDKAA